MTVVETPQCACHFGIARCDITPPVGIYHRMWGASTHDRSTGVHRPLTATAMVFRDAAVTTSDRAAELAVVVSIDHCLLWRREMSELLAQVSDLTNIPLERLFVTFTHTHAAGLMGRERAALPGGEWIGAYLDELAVRIAGIVRKATEDVEPAWIVFGVGRCDLAAHRDYWDAAMQQIVCGFNPAGPTDDTVLVARASSAASGETKAILVNYACHPTSLAWRNTLISPDFPGAMREVIEHAAHAPCVFLQGASGDLGPREGYSGDPAVADRNGRQLGYAALSALESLPAPGTSFRYAGAVVSGATLGAWEHGPMGPAREQRCHRFRLRSWTLRLPLRGDMPTMEQTRAELADWQAREAAALAQGDQSAAGDFRAQVERMTRRLVKLAELPTDGYFELPLTLLQAGEAYWLMLEGEYYNWLQRELRLRFPQTPIMIATLTNGWRTSYVVPASDDGRGFYQEQVAVLAPGGLEQTLEAASAAIRVWRDD